MDWKDITHGTLFVLEIVMVVATLIKVVTKIETTTAMLGQSLEFLGEKIEDFSKIVQTLDGRTDDHHERIVKLETRLEETSRHKVPM